MEYHVKVIPPSGRARVHEAECKYCEKGKGMKNQDKGLGPTYWHPAFPARGFRTIAEAKTFMDTLGPRYSDIGLCAYCMKGLIDP